MDPVVEVEQLRRALETRTVIGQAMGILMERNKITEDEAFDSLRWASQHANVRLAQIAQDLAKTGQWPPTELVARPRAREFENSGYGSRAGRAKPRDGRNGSGVSGAGN